MLFANPFEFGVRIREITAVERCEFVIYRTANRFNFRWNTDVVIGPVIVFTHSFVPQFRTGSRRVSRASIARIGDITPSRARISAIGNDFAVDGSLEIMLPGIVFNFTFEILKPYLVLV